jgi:hypothetical protein
MSDVINRNMSIFNPADNAAMKQMGAGNIQGKTVADVLATFGISPDDPAEKLVQFGKQQMQNANPLNKMKNIARDAGNTPQAPEQPPEDDLGAFEGLMRNRR